MSSHQALKHSQVPHQSTPSLIFPIDDWPANVVLCIVTTATRAECRDLQPVPFTMSFETASHNKALFLLSASMGADGERMANT